MLPGRVPVLNMQHIQRKTCHGALICMIGSGKTMMVRSGPMAETMHEFAQSNNAAC